MGNGSGKLETCGGRGASEALGVSRGPAATDLSAGVWGAAGGQRVSLRLGEGPLATLSGETILIVAGR